jgi:glycosyltransferase involved in cell wall biosynthesis
MAIESYLSQVEDLCPRQDIGLVAEWNSSNRVQRMKILLLCEGDAETWDSWSGISRSVLDQLRANGHTVICGDVDLYGFLKYRVLACTFSAARQKWWVRYHLGPAGFRARSRNAQRLVKEHVGKFDVILQFGATFIVDAPSTPYFLYCDSNIEFARDGLASGHSEAVSLTQSEADAVREREAMVYARADGIFTLSELLKRSFTQRLGVPEDRVEAIYAGPNFRFGVSPEVPARNGAAPVVLFIGRTFLRKGGDVLLSAFRTVREKVPDAKLLIIGPVQLPSDLEFDLDGVEVMGFLDKETDEGQAALHEAYARAMVFCLPTRFEPFGVVFLEAMHYELPCVATNGWAVPEIVADGSTGLLVPPDDSDALASALIELLQDPERSRRMGKLGKERLMHTFTWPHVIVRMTATMERLRSEKRVANQHDLTF